ncbi:MAG: polymerase subunit sigma-70 [Bacteroidetes bacterium]|nr:polymerase subunit sigma-70 [Bacteroidota bacterium]
MSKSNLQLTDSQFLQGLRTGNNEVLTALYKKYYNLVLKLVVNNSGTSDAAKDVYQETIIVLFENSKKPHFELNCQLQTFIYSVAKRLWLKQLKKNGGTFLIKEDKDAAIADVSEDISFHEQQEQDFEKVNQSLLQLGEPCATIIKDFYVSKLSMDEIAEKFGYTNADNAKNQKYKCLQRLKKSFFDKGAVLKSEIERK